MCNWSTFCIFRKVDQQTVHMKTISIFLLALTTTFTAICQRTETNHAIEVSKKLLLDTTSEGIFKYFSFEYDNGSYYKLGGRQKKYGYIPTRTLLPDRRFKSGWTEIWVRYDFNYPEVKGLKYATWVKLTKDLQLAEPIQLDFIPTFIWKNETSNFISEQTAAEIASKQLKDTTLGRSSPYLSFDKNLKKYIYTITNNLTKSVGQSGKDIGTMEILKLDAETGASVEKTTGAYGFYIR